MSEFEVFRITPTIGKYYEHAEYTRQEGRWPNQRYYTKTLPKYVGEFIKWDEGGCGDGSWRIDYFRQADGTVISVPYTYEGTTSFREALMLPQLAKEINSFTPLQPPSLQEIIEMRLSTKELQEWKEINNV